jgi:hypothetical protein
MPPKSISHAGQQREERPLPNYPRPADQRHEFPDLRGVRCARFTVEFPGAPQHSAGDVELPVRQAPRQLGEIQQPGGLFVDFDGLAGGGVDARDDVVVAVAAVFPFDLPGAGGDRASRRLCRLPAGGIHEHFAWAAQRAETRPLQPSGVQSLK